MDSLRRDPVNALRRLLAAPAFAVLAVTLSANAAIYGALYVLFQRPLSVVDPDRLAWGRETAASRDVALPGAPSGGRFPAGDGRGAFAAAGPSRDWVCHLGGDGAPEAVNGYRFSGNFFEILGVPAHLGRTIGPEDARPGHEKVVVLADSLWRRRFASDPRVIGRAITLDGESYTVVGVMPPEFAHPPRVELWAPFRVAAPGTPAPPSSPQRVRCT